MCIRDRSRSARAPRANQGSAYGPNAGLNTFAYFHGEDESSFSVVDNSRSSATRRGAASSAARGARTTALSGQRGGRRGGMPSWERTQRRTREASITVGPDWEQLSEMDFSRLHKLRMEVGEPEELSSYGTLYQYDRSYDRVSVRFQRLLQPRDRVHYNPTTLDDPVMQEIAESPENKAQVFVTDSILALLMCSPRSVYPLSLIHI